MALQEALTKLTFEAGGDLSSHQFKFVSVASDTQVDLTATAGAVPVGVLQNNPSAAGQEAEVAVAGRVKVIAGAGGVTAGATVSTTNAGLAVTSATTGHAFIGRALTSAAAGEMVEVLLGYIGAAP